MKQARLLALPVLAALLLLPGVARASASGVVVSQVYGGGGNADASFRNDFVELYNAGGSAVDLSSWTIQYATASGTSWHVEPLTGSISPGGHYLLQLASSGDVGDALPTPDATGTANLSASSGKVALVRDSTELTCGASAGSCSGDSLVEDLVGYGAASDFEGSGSAPGLSSTAAALRGGDGCLDTGDNAADFTSATPAPRTAASPAQACGTEPPPGGGSGSGSGSGSDSGSGSASVDVDVAPVLSMSLDRPTLSFGSTTFGEAPAPIAENVKVTSNDAGGYSLQVDRTAFAPSDLPLAVSATAPAGGQLGAALAGGGLVPIPVAPASALPVGTTDGPSADDGDAWATQVGFSAPLPLVPSGRYTANVTFTVVSR